MAMRYPICCFLGHVDHGKSSILDRIRNTSIVKSEPGAITQSIGASIVPINVIKSFCKKQLERWNINFTIPGLLFIDTPGHAAFTSLRKRGGVIADIAVLVVDINEGFMPQTREAIEILKAAKTPFVIAANKIDIIDGFKHYDLPLIETINKQSEGVIQKLEKKLYNIVGQVAEFGMNSDRFDRVDDFSKQVSIIPCSAKTGDGIAELLMIISALAQKYMEQQLKVNIEGPGKGTIFEVKKEKAGDIIDVILYDGKVMVGDILLIAGFKQTLMTKIRGLFEPMPLNEMRDKKAKFKSVKEVKAAMGVRIIASKLENAVAGMPIISLRADSDKQVIDKLKQELQKQVEDVTIETENNGIVIKADTIGSLEAMIKLLKERKYKIMRAAVGDITKSDIILAESNIDIEPLNAIVLGFNVKLSKDIIEPPQTKIIISNIIYDLIDKFEEWRQLEQQRLYRKSFEELTQPAKMEVLINCIFRQSNPCIIGVEIIEGLLRTNVRLIKNDGKSLGYVKSIQKEGKYINEAKKGDKVAIALPDVIAKKHVNEEDVLYTYIPENEFRKMKKLAKYLTKPEIQLLKEIADIMRKQNPVWGV